MQTTFNQYLVVLEEFFSAQTLQAFYSEVFALFSSQVSIPLAVNTLQIKGAKFVS